MKTYIGLRTSVGPQVWVLNPPLCKPLKPIPRPSRHCISPYEWGYAGSGPAQLAFSLLADFCEDAEVAEVLYHRFKFQVIGALEKAGWVLYADQIEAWIISTIGSTMIAAPNGDGTEVSHP